MLTRSEYVICRFKAIANVLVTRLLYEAVTFARAGGIRNLARSDPARISIGVGSQTYLHPVGGGAPFTFVSTVVVGDCHLTQPKMGTNGKWNKFIEGAGIEGEWERLVGALGQIIDKVEYRAQVQGGYVSFSTAFSSAESGAFFGFCEIALSFANMSTAVSSPFGMHHTGGPNPFTCGPSTSASLSCHDISLFFLYLFFQKKYYNHDLYSPHLRCPKS